MRLHRDKLNSINLTCQDYQAKKLALPIIDTLHVADKSDAVSVCYVKTIEERHHRYLLHKIDQLVVGLAYFFQQLVITVILLILK